MTRGFPVISNLRVRLARNVRIVQTGARALQFFDGEHLVKAIEVNTDSIETALLCLSSGHLAIDELRAQTGSKQNLNSSEEFNLCMIELGKDLLLDFLWCFDDEVVVSRKW